MYFLLIFMNRRSSKAEDSAAKTLNIPLQLKPEHMWLNLS